MMQPRPTTTTRLVTLSLCLTLTSPTVAAPRQNGGVSAPGEAIVPCAQYADMAARLRAGLPVQDEWIRRTEEQLNTALLGLTQSKEALKTLAIKNIKDLAARQLGAAKDLEGVFKNAPTLSALTRQRWLQRVDRLKESGETLDKLASSAKAGADFGAAINTHKQLLTEFVTLVQESGIADELGTKAAMLTAPELVIAVEVAMVARDWAYAIGDAAISAADVRQAEQQLSNMRTARKRIADDADDLSRVVAAPPCTPAPPPPADRMLVAPEPAAASPKPPARTVPTPASPAPPPAPATATQPPAAATQQKEEESGGIGTGDVLLLVLGAGAGAAYLYKNVAKNCTAPEKNALSECSNYGGSSSQCQSAVSAHNAYCVCMGYSRSSNGTCVK